MKKLFLSLGIFVFFYGVHNPIYGSDERLEDEFRRKLTFKTLFPKLEEAKSHAVPSPSSETLPSHEKIQRTTKFGVDKETGLIGWRHESLPSLPRSASWKPPHWIDKRVLLKAQDIRSHPYRTILAVESEYLKDDKINTFIGTAVMIHNNVALTAAHNVYAEGYGWSSRISCYIERHGNLYSKKIFVKGYAVPNDYKWNKFSSDYAILYFDKPIGLTIGFLAPLYYMNQTQGIISGYPGFRYDKDFKEIVLEGEKQCVHGDKLYNQGKEYFLYHAIHTTRGQSGAPVYIEHERKNENGTIKEHRIIGVHVAGSPPTCALTQEDVPSDWIKKITESKKIVNKAVRITQAVYNNIRDFSNFFYMNPIKEGNSATNQHLVSPIVIKRKTQEGIEIAIGKAFYINKRANNISKEGEKLEINNNNNNEETN